MGSIPNHEQLAALIEAAARKVAHRLRLPWGLERLREHGRRGVIEASEHDARRSGLSPLQHTNLRINRATQKGGEAMQVGGQPPPSDERIEDALRTFSVEEWKQLIAEFEVEDLKALRSYLDANWEDLELRPYLVGPGVTGKHERIEAFARTRGWILALRHPKANLVDVSGPFWAAKWDRLSRAKNLGGAPRPSKRRSWDEMSSARGIAEALVMAPYRRIAADRYREVLRDKEREIQRKARDVRKWMARMTEEPFEEFDGSLYDYFFKTSDPAAYERYRERRSRSRRRDEE